MNSGNASVTLIVDRFNRYKASTNNGYRVDPEYEASGLRQMVFIYGEDRRCIALVSEDDSDGHAAYREAGYEIVTMPVDREDHLLKFIDREKRLLKAIEPTHLVVVTTDKLFHGILDPIGDTIPTKAYLWADSTEVPNILKNDQRWEFKPLEELLPETKVPKVDIRLDYENLHIGLETMGALKRPKDLIEAVRRAVNDNNLGEIGKIVAYADWDELTKRGSRGLQRELASIDVETRYQINIHGKNTADMEIADDIRSLMEGKVVAPYDVGVFVLGTCDRDFRPLIKTAAKKKKRLVILSLKYGISQHLKTMKEINLLYLDKYLSLSTGEKSFRKPVPWDEFASLVIKITIWIWKRGYKWAFAKDLAEAQNIAEGNDLIERSVADEVLVSLDQVDPNDVTNANARLTLNRNHPLVQTIQRLVGWAPGRVAYLLNEKKMPYVDSNYLAQGMAMDKKFAQLGAGQTRQEAEGWLELVSEADLLVSKTQPHPKSPTIHITTWWLPEMTAEGEVPKPDNGVEDDSPEGDPDLDSNRPKSFMWKQFPGPVTQGA